MDYYKTHALRYFLADEKTKQASREHWERVHIENVNSGREDLIIFSARIIANIALIDAGRAQELLRGGKTA